MYGRSRNATLSIINQVVYWRASYTQIHLGLGLTDEIALFNADIRYQFLLRKVMDIKSLKT